MEFFPAFLLSADFFKINIFQKFFQECQTVWIQIRPGIMGPNCLQKLSAGDTSKKQVKITLFCFNYSGIEGAFSAPGGKTVIPRKVIGKFSIRLVPDMLPDDICAKVTKHIEKLHEKSGSPNSVK